MNDGTTVREGLTVVGPDGETLGPVERVHDDGFDVAGLHLPLTAVAAVDAGTIRLADTSRVHLVERRLAVEEARGVDAPPAAGGARPA
ncbi:MAG TPA: hypothetical protein VFW96_16435 [Thermomicrobiales bacterium]|nr:hypothetical protein [Thermomicrobiales bacterium]